MFKSLTDICVLVIDFKQQKSVGKNKIKAMMEMKIQMDFVKSRKICNNLRTYDFRSRTT